MATSPLVGVRRRRFWASGCRGVFSTCASGHFGVSVEGCAHNFDLYGGDSCGDLDDLGRRLIF